MTDTAVRRLNPACRRMDGRQVARADGEHGGHDAEREQPGTAITDPMVGLDSG